MCSMGNGNAKQGLNPALIALSWYCLDGMSPFHGERQRRRYLLWTDAYKLTAKRFVRGSTAPYVNSRLPHKELTLGSNEAHTG